MTVLVTGATGFIGSHLVRRLHATGVQVRVFCRPTSNLSVLGDTRNLEVVYGDLTDQSSVVRAVNGCDTVYHLGAATRGPWEDFQGATIGGTRAVLEAAKQAGVRKLVYGSSTAVYDLSRCKSEALIQETSEMEHRPEARSYYVQAKVAAERLVLQALEEGQLPLCVLRPAVVYGVWGPRPAFQAGFFLRNRVFVLLGSKNRLVPLVHVDDVVDAFLLEVQRDQATGRVYNVVAPGCPTQKEYLREYRVAMGIRAPAVFLPTFATASAAFLAQGVLRVMGRAPLGDPRYRLARAAKSVRYDIAGIQQDLGWRAKVSMRDGLRQQADSLIKS